MSGLTPLVALERMRKFCIYQDRSHSEVRTKLLKHEVYGDDLDDIIHQLVEDGYLDEERFARSFVRGKFRINQWGKYKITMHLKQKRVSDYCIRKGMEEIDEEEYIQLLDRLLLKKLANKTDRISKQKAKDALMRKGFEPALVYSRLAQISE